MDKDENFSDPTMPPSFSTLHQDFNLPQSSHHHLLLQDQFMKSRSVETSGENTTGILSNYFLNNPQQQQYLLPPHQQINSLEKLAFGDVMQFSDFGPKLSLNGQNNKFSADDQDGDSAGIDPVYFLKFPVLNERDQMAIVEGDIGENRPTAEDGEGRVSEHSSVQIRSENENNNGGKNKRKRVRTVKTSEEVESQRMTHIAVERNRRKQMNEHLRVLRSLMPGSYVQRGDQASIIGGAIEFVRELEQLLQCLESQKRRRLLGESPTIQPGFGPPSDSSSQLQTPPFLPPGTILPNQNDNQLKVMDFETTTAMIREETAESKSCLADVEVKVVGFDAMIKILSRRRPGQLIKAIAALEDLQLNILHTNITTIEQTVLYSFNVKVASESRFTAEDIASSVQQIFGFIHANTTM